MLQPALRLAEDAQVRAKDLQHWARLGYFKVLRDGGRTIGEAAEALGVSEPTANRIARQLRSDFLTPWEEHELPKQIVLALWQRPRSMAKLCQLFPHAEEKEVRRALRSLLSQKRIRRSAGRDEVFETAHEEDRLVGPDAHTRLGALQSLLHALYKLVRRRIFEEDASAFVRTITFRIPPDGGAKLEAFYQDTIWPFLQALEEEAAELGSDQRTQFSVFWTPEEDEEVSL